MFEETPPNLPVAEQPPIAPTPTPEPSQAAFVQQPAPSAPPAEGAATTVPARVGPATYRELMARTNQLWAKRGKTAWALAAVQATVILLQAFAQIALIGGSFVLALASPGLGGAAVIGGILVIIILHLASVVVSAAWLHATAGSDESIGAGEALRRGLGHFLPFLWLSILSSWVILGGSLLIYPGIVWSLSFPFAYWVLVKENLRGRDALVRSRQLVIGDGWWVFFKSLILALAIGLTAAVASIPGAILSGIVESAAGKSSWLNIFPAFLFALLISKMVGPRAAGFMYAMYENLRVRKDGAPRELPKHKKYFTIAMVFGLLTLPLVIGTLGFSMWAQYKAASQFRSAIMNAVDDGGDAFKLPPSTGTKREQLAHAADVIEAIEAYAKAHDGFYPALLGTSTLGIDPDTEEGARYDYERSDDSKGFSLQVDVSGQEGNSFFFNSFPVRPGDATKDEDADGLSLVEELRAGTDDDEHDTDEDGASDGDEARAGTDPLAKDAARAPASEASEPAPAPAPTAPVAPATDDDKDGFHSGYEASHVTDPANPDTDGDGLSDGDEFLVFGTDPKNKDTDGDSFSDGSELKNGYNAREASKKLTESDLDGYADTAVSQDGLHEPTRTTLKDSAVWKRYVDKGGK